MQADLPIDRACEPEEGAHQPKVDDGMPSPYDRNKSKKHGISFAESTQSAEISSSLNTNSSYKEVLSQPAPGLSHRQRLLWLQKRRQPGLWTQCDDCGRWRHLPHVIDSHELPKQWYCRMNPDKTAADCSVPEVPIRLRDEEDLIHSEYSAGSVVWARLAGWPWWPAMVDDCPDTEQFYWLDGFSDIPTSYNVVFFDAFEVTRAWINPENLKPYRANRKTLRHVANDRRYKNRLEVAMRQADDADMLSLADRLAKYSFINRYKGTIRNPIKVNKKNKTKYKKQFKRKLNIDFSDESDTESDDSSQNVAKISPKRQAMRNTNVIIVGTPKRQLKSKNKVNKLEGNQEKTNDSEIQRDSISSQDSRNVEEGVQKNNTEISEDVFKQPCSLTVQVGSTSAVAVDSINIDLNEENDSSKTCVPETFVRQELLESPTDFTNLQVRISTPNSDDFEF